MDPSQSTPENPARSVSEDHPLLDTTGCADDDVKRRSQSGGWKACAFILGNECSERLAYFGISTNLVTYLIHEYHQGNAMAANTVSTWSGTGYVTPLIGAFLADAYWGRYKTIATFSTLYLVGLILLTLSASVPSLKPPVCTTTGESSSCQAASFQQLLFFYVSLYFVAFGMGGIKPCISAFGADQFDSSDPVEKKQKSHFFNWFYLSINVGGLVATTFLVYIQDNASWAWGFGIPAICMAFSIFCFFLGTPLYRQQKPGGSPVVRVAQVLVAASRKFHLKLPVDRSLLYNSTRDISSLYTDDLRFLEKAAIRAEVDGRKGGCLWRLCPMTQVEEVKTLLRIFPVWATLIMFTTVYSQLFTTFVEQGTRMNTQLLSFHVSPASMTTLELLTVIFMVPLYDRVLVNLARRLTNHPHGFSQLQRMGVGLGIGILSMVFASAVESVRLALAKQHGLVNDPLTPVPMSIFWQLPQIVILGVAETFTYIGQLEFFYEQAPDSMRSLGTALALTSYGLGNYLNGVLITMVSRVTGWIPDNLNEGKLNYYFNLLGVLSGLNLVVYVYCAKSFRYRENKSLECYNEGDPV